MSSKSRNILKVFFSVVMCFLVVFAPQHTQFADAKKKTSSSSKSSKSSSSSKSSKSSSSSSSTSKSSSSSSSTTSKSSSSTTSSTSAGRTSYSNSTYFFYFSPSVTRNHGYLRHKHKSYKIYLDVARDSTKTTENTDFVITTYDPDIVLSKETVKINGKSVGTFSRTDRSRIDITNLSIDNGKKAEVKVQFEDYYTVFGKRYSKTKNCTFKLSISEKA